MGAIVNADNQAIQLRTKLVNVPWLNCGICAVPPATGKSTDNSAKVSAIIAVAIPPINQATIADEPAILAAYKGANSHAEPTMPLILKVSKLMGVKRLVSSVMLTTF